MGQTWPEKSTIQVFITVPNEVFFINDKYIKYGTNICE